MATVAEVEHGQLNGNTEQMDFRKSISSSASAFSSLFLSLVLPVFLVLIVITVVFLRFVDVASNSVCKIFSALLFFFFKLKLSSSH